jgi:uncharacterized protein (DUF736 family)
MTIAENNYQYDESDSLITGWHKVTITEITEPKRTKSGDATGFMIKLDVRVKNEIIERSIWLSFDHPSEFVVKKSTNIGAMLRGMFPAVTIDEDYVGCSFWLLFRLYDDKKTGEKKENFFDFKRNVSLDGRLNLDGIVITEDPQTETQNHRKAHPVKKPQTVTQPSSADDGDDVPF